MEYEIRDDPQGLEERDHANRDGGLVEDHVALERQRSVAIYNTFLSEHQRIAAASYSQSLASK